MTGEARYLPIAEHGLIGDLRTVALVGPPAGRSSGSDHYLGKEAVQNILIFRFANSMVERAWCGEAVDPRPDHRGRVRRHRAARPPFRGSRRAARHGREPPAPGARVRRDGAARLARTGGRSRPQGGAARGRAPVLPGRDRQGSTEPGWSRGTRCRDTGMRNGSRRSRPSRCSWRCAPGSTTRDRLARAEAPAVRGRGDRAPAGPMAGDQTLFLREDVVEWSWEIVAPILDASVIAHPYAAGTWGPTDRPARVAPRLSHPPLAVARRAPDARRRPVCFLYVWRRARAAGLDSWSASPLARP